MSILSTAARRAAGRTPPAPSTLVTAEPLLDPPRLSELLGRPVAATRLRHKPGRSTTAALVATAGPQAGHPCGWVQVVLGPHHDKLANAVRRAERRERALTVVELGPVPGEVEPMSLVAGPVDSDPRLTKGLSAIERVVPSVDQAAADGAITVVRYNPHRRLVLRHGAQDRREQGSRSIRVTAHPAGPDSTLHVLRHLESMGLPVVLPLTTPAAVGRIRDRGAADGTGRVTVWPWLGTGDLAGAPDVGAAVSAGAALARVHSAPTELGRADHSVGALEDRGVALAHDLADLDPTAAHRFRALASALGLRSDREPVLVHGDFSADQVLVGAPGIRLIDFDRVGQGDPWLDLGTFVADQVLRAPGRPWHDSLAEGEIARALLSGYAAAGGTAPGDDEIRPWVARALLARASEPFRRAEPGWRSDVHDRLDQIADVLGWPHR